MRGRLRRLALIASVLSVLLLPANAGATEPISGGGTFTVTSTEITSTQVTDDGDVILTILVTSTLTGIMEGTTVAEERAVVHPDGLITVNTFDTFTGTVNGIAGTAVFRVVGVIDATGALTGQFSIFGGTGGLANLRGQGTIEGVGDVGTYAVDIHFDPAS